MILVKVKRRYDVCVAENITNRIGRPTGYYNTSVMK